MKLLGNSNKIAEIQSRLAKYNFLSRANLPGYLDGLVFQNLQSSQKYPDRKTSPYFYHWYILMRQFAGSTIRKWIDTRLYFDSDDSLIKHFTKQDEPPFSEIVQIVSCGSPPREQGLGELKSPKPQSTQIEYVIDILLKQYSEQIMARLKSCLQNYRVQICTAISSRQVKIKCCSQSSRQQEIVNLVSKSIEYQNLQVKRQKKTKNWLRQEPIRQ